MNPKPKRRKSPARKDGLLRRYETTVGRDKMLEVLDWSADQRAVALAAMLCDPAYRRFSFAKLCQRVGLRHVDVLDLFRRHQLDLAILRVSCRLPDVMRQTADDALSRMEDCRVCDGAGEIPVGKKMKLCRACKGRGEIYTKGDLACQKIIWNMMVKPYLLVGRTR